MKRNNSQYRISKPRTHHKAIKLLSETYKMPYDKVQKILNSFFGINGIKYFLKKRQSVAIKSFGVFYFHKASVKKYLRDKERKRLYNSGIKQKLYIAKKRGNYSVETELLRKKYK